MAYFEDNSQTIGNTPLVKLNRVTDGARAPSVTRFNLTSGVLPIVCELSSK